MDKRNSNIRQGDTYTPYQTGASAVTVTAGDFGKVYYSTFAGTATYTLPKATAGAGPFYWQVNGASNVIKLTPASTDNIAGLGAGTSFTLPAVANVTIGLVCVIAGFWTPIMGTGPQAALIATVTIYNSNGTVNTVFGDSAGVTVTIPSGSAFEIDGPANNSVPTFLLTGASQWAQFHQNAAVGSSGGDYPAFGYNFKTTNVAGSYKYQVTDTAVQMQVSNAQSSISFKTAPSGTAGNAITFTTQVIIGTNPQITLNGSSVGVAAIRINTSATTGTGTATFTATNKPTATAGGPVSWIPINLDGSVRYIPAWA